MSTRRGSTGLSYRGTPKVAQITPTHKTLHKKGTYPNGCLLFLADDIAGCFAGDASMSLEAWQRV